jgi:putative PIN family toxin of toxin-antitoxin system
VARRVVFDTNVLISGYLWKGPPRRAIEKVRSGEWTLIVSKDTIDELIRVLGYNKFGLKPEEIEPIVRDLVEISEFVEV